MKNPVFFADILTLVAIAYAVILFFCALVQQTRLYYKRPQAMFGRVIGGCRQLMTLQSFSLKWSNLWSREANDRLWLTTIFCSIVLVVISLLGNVPWQDALVICAMPFPIKIAAVMAGKLAAFLFSLVFVLMIDEEQNV